MLLFLIKKNTFLKINESSKLNDQIKNNDEFKEEKAIYHANQINEHSKVEETVKDAFLNKDNQNNGNMQLVYLYLLNYFCQITIFFKAFTT